MHITNQDQLKKQKKKLSILFTVILFGVVVGLQIIFLIGRYIDDSQKEFRKLDGDGMPRGKIIEAMMSGNKMMDPMPPMPMFGGEGRGWRLKGGNMILVNSNRILTSSIGDETVTNEIIKEINQVDKNKGSILYNETRFLFSREILSGGIVGYFLVPAQTSVGNIIKDIVLFILFFGLCSILFYRVIYWFVGRMFLPIEENMQDMEQFIFNAGHELKTPLSVVKSHLQLALAKKQYKTAIDESVKELDKMNLLLESLINISVVHQESEKTGINVGQEITYIVAQYSQQAKKKNVSIEVKAEDELIISANKGHFHMLVSNLIANAIKYNKKGGTINITVTSGEIIITDTGIGIPSKDIPKIFDRFYQVGNIRNQEGFGIGLALVKKIGDMYGWKIEVQSEENSGTTFKIKF